MGEVDDVYIQRIREELARDDTAQRIVRLATRWRRNLQDAQDLAQSTITRILAEDAWKWHPSRKEPFLDHVASVMENLASVERRSFRVQNEVVSGKVARDERRADDAPLPDEALDEARTRASLAKMQREVLAALDENDRPAAAIYRAIIEGRGPAAVTEYDGYSADDVRFARERIQSRWRDVWNREQRAEHERLRALRAKPSGLAPQGAVP